MPGEEPDKIYFVPPSFLSVDISFEHSEDFSNSFNKLSSGEKQKIYATSSILYHLRYLDSVKRSAKLPHKYNHINLIFDKLELYYHPELQRNFINDFLETLRYARLQNMESLNCLFITHSPFILSDIPSANVLYLKRKTDGPGTEQIMPDSESFGANVHDLLANDFFMDDGFMGAHAQSIILDLLNWLTDDSERKDGNPKANPKLVCTEEKAEMVIELIGEPLIKGRLTDLLETRGKIKKRENLKRRIEQLNNQLSNLNE